MAVTDALGSRVHFVILPGQTHDLKGAPAALEDLDCGARIADTAFDADSLLADLESRSITAVIPARRNRTAIRGPGRGMSAGRHPIETSLPNARRSGALGPASTRRWCASRP